MRRNKHPVTTHDYIFARQLRNGASPVEQKLWKISREAAKIKNLKFRRQQPIHPYIVDFACMAAKLLVEIDGDSHIEQQEYDRVRTDALIQLGFHVIRFTNAEVIENAEGVVLAIVSRAEELLLKPTIG